MARQKPIDVAAMIRHAQSFGVTITATDPNDIDSILESHGENLASSKDAGGPVEKGSAAAKARMKKLREMRGKKGKSSSKPSAKGKRDKTDDEKGRSSSAKSAKANALSTKRGQPKAASGKTSVSAKTKGGPRSSSKPASLKMISKRLDSILDGGLSGDD